MRNAVIERKTAETDIKIELNIDGTGSSSISTGCGFLNHMLTLFAKHGRFDLNVYCKGDADVDYHHTVEDIGIALGQALKQCVGDGKGITRYADIILPMDEALILVAADICGRSYLGFGLELNGVWYAMYIDWIVRSTIFVIHFIRGKWKTIKVI